MMTTMIVTSMLFYCDNDGYDDQGCYAGCDYYGSYDELSIMSDNSDTSLCGGGHDCDDCDDYGYCHDRDACDE